jgi:hypothetical protein
MARHDTIDRVTEKLRLIKSPVISLKDLRSEASSDFHRRGTDESADVESLGIRDGPNDNSPSFQKVEALHLFLVECADRR